MFTKEQNENIKANTRFLLMLQAFARPLARLDNRGVARIFRRGLPKTALSYQSQGLGEPLRNLVDQNSTDCYKFQCKKY